jgi:hypothetical protein
MAHTRTIRRWIGGDVDMFRCAACGVTLGQPDNIQKNSSGGTIGASDPAKSKVRLAPAK